jgi:predicted DsbA family dithiol-disulfide isomerase
MSSGKAGEPVSVDVISDVVCPWCFIGKRRLEQAVAMSDTPLTIRWRPFQLDPTIPPEGKSRRAYLEQKFGSAERIKEIYERVAAVGAEVGIPFAFDRIEVSPNTLDAHRLIRWAGEYNLQDAVVEALFSAYFIDGKDIGDRALLADIAAGAGMDRAQIAERLASEDDRAEVRADIVASQRIGVTGVPTYILASRYGLVGAQPAEELARAFRQVAKDTAGEAAA